MAGFIKAGPRPKPVPSTVASSSAPTPTVPAVKTGDETTGAPCTNSKANSLALNAPKWPQNATGCIASNEPLLIRELHHLVTHLPDTIPCEIPGEGLSMFSENPKDLDNPAVKPEGLWQEVINPLLKKALGWGVFDKDLIRRGAGMNGIVDFVRYFVCERKVGVALFEGKLLLFMEHMRAV